jgi:NadR type nicotinamide-nucleotide adenylyltransferase
VIPKLRCICVTGPESTGKTTLAARLAELANTEWVPEASRSYAERKGSELLASDVEPIAREHIALEDTASIRERVAGASLLVLDTDLLSTVIYSRYYYGEVPAWIERAERARRAELYLLCDIDVPWVADGIRDRPAKREEMFALFHEALLRRRTPFVRVRGSWEERWDIARTAIAPFVVSR